jgi:hypothetical protein
LGDVAGRGADGIQRVDRGVLDTYLGVMTGDTDVSLRRVDEALDDALGEGDEAHTKPDSGRFPSQPERRTHRISGDEEVDDGEH